jgi:hypothetical protein
VISLAKRVTEAFKNSEVILPPSDFIAENFEKQIIKVPEFLSASGPDFQKSFQHQLLSGLAETLVGLYFYFHSNSTYKNGYDHPETRRLGWM